MRRRRSGIVVNAIRRAFRAPAPPANPAPEAPLAPLPGLPGEPLAWSHPKARASAWRLDGAAGPLAHVSGGWQKRTARTSRGAWTLLGDGHTRMRACRDGSREADVTFEVSVFARDRVRRAAGETLRWHRNGLTAWRLETEDGRILLELHRRGFLHPVLELTLSEAARALPDLDALVLVTGMLPHRSSHAY